MLVDSFYIYLFFALVVCTARIVVETERELEEGERELSRLKPGRGEARRGEARGGESTALDGFEMGWRRW